MKLLDLDAKFVRLSGDGHRYCIVDSITDAQGVFFQCPKCAEGKKPGQRVHRVHCWFEGRDVPDGEPPVPGRWKASGSGLADLTLSPSVWLSGSGCGWHGWVVNGDAA